MVKSRLVKWCIGALLTVVGSVLVLQACSGGGSGATSAAPAAATPESPPATASSASVRRGVEVPSALAWAPFDSTKSLVLPPGFGIRVWARVDKARFMALAPNGDVLVSVPEQGKVVLLRERANDVPQQFDFVTGLSRPHDMVFHTIGSVTYLYLSESNRITRSVYQSGDTQSAARETVVANLPDESTPELGGAYGHALKNIALGPDNKLYVSIGSSCNACTGDTQSDPVRGAIYQYNADGTGGRLFARGIRNAEGLDFLPGTTSLWMTINERDEIAYPYHQDADGDGSDDFGKVMPAFVDDNPPDSFTPVRDGANYGWPYCNAVPAAGMSNLSLMRDAEFNGDGTQLDCATAERRAKGIAAHSAPLGFSFLQDSSLPPSYRNGAVLASHGCWNCTSLKAGYKVSFIPFDGAGNAGAELDFVTGFVTDPAARSVWGRPVDAIADAKGNLLVSDDFAGAIYQVYPLP